MGRRLDQQRVSVRLRLDHCLRADLSARAGAVLDNHRLMPSLAQVLADDATGNIGARAGGERYDHADRMARIVLGYRRVRCRRDQHRRDRIRGHTHSPPFEAALRLCAGSLRQY